MFSDGWFDTLDGPAMLPDRMGRRLDRWMSNFVNHHTHPEWTIGLAIMTLWAVVAFANFGLVAAAMAVVLGVMLHYVAIETGSHVWLWLATGTVLVYCLIAYAVVLEPLGPIALTLGGSSGLAYNETIRLNYSRRRNAVVDRSVFAGSALAVAVASVIGLVGIGASVLLTRTTDRTWLWMPVAVIALIAVAYALVIVPTLRAPHASSQRWIPGTRIPPHGAAGGGTKPLPPPPA